MDANNTTGTQSGECNRCSKPGRPCTGCDGARAYEGDLGITYYCGKACQKADSKHHEDLCNRRQLRKRFYHAVLVLHRVWEAFREESFDLQFVAAPHYEGDVVHVWRADTILGMNGLTPPFKPPEGLKWPQWVRKSLLNVNECIRSIIMMEEVLKAVLQGEYDENKTNFM